MTELLSIWTVGVTPQLRWDFIVDSSTVVKGISYEEDRLGCVYAIVGLMCDLPDDDNCDWDWSTTKVPNITKQQKLWADSYSAKDPSDNTEEETVQSDPSDSSHPGEPLLFDNVIEYLEDLKVVLSKAFDTLLNSKRR